MTVYEIDPLRDSRWADLAGKHPRASVFHTPPWLEALRRTYGYEPVAYTTTPPGTELANGIVCCRVYSRITGRRLVSLPFSDHCEPLVESSGDLETLLHALELECARERWRYVEIRPRETWGVPIGKYGPTDTFHFHTIDLNAEPEEIFHRFHRDSIQRKIRRATREGLTYETGRSEALLDTFYRLLLRTRRRQHLPPHPRDWFCNVLESLGENAKIWVTSKDGQPIASIVTLFFRGLLMYKYGCSDERYHRLGGMHLLFWNAILEGKKNGAREFDFGRSDLDHHGLVTFKNRWGSTRSQLTYWRYPAPMASAVGVDWGTRVAMKIFGHLPPRLAMATGKMLYRHVG